MDEEKKKKEGEPDTTPSTQSTESEGKEETPVIPETPEVSDEETSMEKKEEEGKDSSSEDKKKENKETPDKAECGDKEKKKSYEVADSDIEAYEFFMSIGSLYDAKEAYQNNEKKVLEFTKSFTTYEEKAKAQEAKISELQAKVDKYELTEKENIFSQYESFVDSTIIEGLRAELGKFSAEQLEKELLFAAKPALFSQKSDSAPASIEVKNFTEDGALLLLRKQKEKSN